MTCLDVEREAEKKVTQESLELALGRLARVDNIPGPEGATFTQLLRDNCVLRTEVIYKHFY